LSVTAASLTEVFRRGFADHQAGRLGEAEAAYRQVLAAEPRHADALHFLGVIAHQVGKDEIAADLIGRAIDVDAAQAAYHCNLGLILCTLGRPGEAERSLRAALALRPEFPEALNHLGIALHRLGRPGEAEASYREALRLMPNFADALNNLGISLAGLGRSAEALACYREALHAKPDFPDAFANLGIVLAALGRPAEAEECYRQALRLRPDFPGALNNLGAALTTLGRAEEAEACFRAVVRLQPDLADAHSNLAVALCDLRRHAEAEVCAREAIRLQPAYADAHSNLGTALFDLRRLGEAEASYREALRLKPDFPQAHMNLASTLLVTARFAEGWEEHEWRWKAKHLMGGARGFAAPLWRGEALGEGVLLLHAEQGLGDTLQFCRYAPLAAERARVALEVQAPLKRLLSRLGGVSEVLAQGEALPPFAAQAPLMSLPRAFGAVIPAKVPYLAADPGEAALWRERLAGLGGLKVGLCWAGEPRKGFPELAAVDARRSITLAAMAPLATVEGVSFVSLQKGAPALQAAAPPPGMTLADPTWQLADFADTAALIETLDLVISVDTSVAHLAGAMAKPIWLLNRFDGCWRWLLDRDDSPWYPTLRQFRQPAPGDWTSVLDAATKALQALADGDTTQLRPTLASGPGAFPSRL
jgi:tetratricopeptide (TPR) repeat protein